MNDDALRKQSKSIIGPHHLARHTNWRDTPLGETHHLARHNHLARHFSGIFAHYTAEIVITALLSIAYEG
jgi:hypothetical protein